MALELKVYQELPQHTQTVTLEGVQYRLRLTWFERLQAWYLDLYQLDETPIALGRRVTPEWAPLARLLPVGKPTGELYVRGPDPYRRDELGPLVLLRYYTADEIGEPPSQETYYEVSP